MKKILLLICITLVPILMAQAQYVRYGGKAGGGFTRALGDDGSNDYMNYFTGFHAGPVVSYEFVSRLAVQAELLYDQKGFTYDAYAVNPSVTANGDLRLHYVKLPLLLKIQKGGLFAEAGPYAGYLVATNSDINFSTTGVNPDAGQPITYNSDNINRFDYGYTAGIGIMLESGFFMSFRNTGGFRSFSKDLDQKNFGFNLSFGYLIQPPSAVDMMRR
ncbi:porin family protein [Pontibacter pamirensis]|uniref:porin family protein n=1 Tax=Pontibacter pamirensis TaxID=2562824 RepID=UPI00138A2893|nr:porin family protein [Pontibacter pamirensis]